MRAAAQDPATRGDESRHALCTLARRNTIAGGLIAAPAATSDWRAARKGYVASMTNPKSVAFYGSIFALRAPAHAPAWLDLSVVVLSVATPAAWYCTMALLASRPSVRRLLVRRKAALDTAAGLLLMAVGGRMLAGR